MEQLPLNALRAFEATIRLGSFKAAAEELCVTQSAVSHQMRHLEEWLEMPLFSRVKGRPQVLPHANLLAQTLAQSFFEITTACTRARASQKSSPLVIAAIPSVAVCWLIPRLSSFREANPGIEIRVIYAMHGRDIDFREVHLAFVFAEAPPRIAGTTVEPFLPGDSVPVCSPLLASRMGHGPFPATYSSWGLLHDTSSTGWALWLTKAGIAFGADLAGPVFEDFNLLRSAALSGQGVALCPAAMIRDDLDAGRLVQLSSITVLEGSGYFLVSGHQSDPGIAAAALAFRQWALATRDRQGAPQQPDHAAFGQVTTADLL